jgi:YgiT-type zinc finger domain-containing protein
MVGKYLKRCPICGGAIRREKTAYVVGRVVVEPELDADVCTKCEEEFYTAEQVAGPKKRHESWGS